MALSTEELNNMETFLRQRRLGGIARAGQTLGATGAVMSGREKGAEAFASRDPYPGLRTPEEKALMKGEHLQAAGQLEKGYYDTSIGVLTNDYNQKMALLQSWLQNDTSRRNQSAAVNQRGRQTALAAESGNLQRLGQPTEVGVAFLETLPRAPGAAAELDITSPGGLFSLFQQQDPALAVAPVEGNPELESKLEAFIYERTVALKVAQTEDDVDGATRIINDINAALAATGVDPSEVYQEGGSGLRVYQQGVADAAERVGESMQRYDAGIQENKRLGVQGLTSFEDLAAGAPSFGDAASGQPTEGQDLDGDGLPDIYAAFDPQKQLMPGVDIAPASDALERYVQFFDTIDSRPEHPPAQETKAYMLQTPDYQNYKKSRGYENMSDRLVWNEYKREARQQLRERNKDFKAQRRANIEAGRSAPTPFQKPKEREQPEKTAVLLAETE